MMDWLYDLQRCIHDDVTRQITAVAQTRDLATVLPVLALGVVFGAIHAVTPGHSRQRGDRSRLHRWARAVSFDPVRDVPCAFAWRARSGANVCLLDGALAWGLRWQLLQPPRQFRVMVFLAYRLGSGRTPSWQAAALKALAAWRW